MPTDAPSAPTATPAVAMRGISKAFPGVQALDGVDFVVAAGEVHALLGENGAGKSTLVKILAGAQTADRGDIELFGRRVRLTTPQAAQQAGVSVIYQEFNLVPAMSVAENIFLGREPTGRGGRILWPRMYAEAAAILERIGMPLDVRAPVRGLSVAHQQVVEIAKALSMNARILAMDEPTATLTDHEVQTLFALIRSLREQGVSIIYISHRLEEIFEIADRVTVMRDGRLIGVRDTDKVTRKELIRMMVGREVDLGSRQDGNGGAGDDVVMSVRGIRRAGLLHDISFDLRRGEILAITGLVGAGRTELARVIFGADRSDSGEVLLAGAPVRVRSPLDAVRSGIGLVPEDRKLDGLVLTMSVRENTTLAGMQQVVSWGVVDGRKERAATQQLVDQLRVRTPGIEQKVHNLSGGNQQKVVLAKWLFTDCEVLIFDEPTRGVDVGAKSEIHDLMRQLAADGKGVIMISSELPEVLQVSDRVLVMHEGRITAEMPTREATQESIMHYATGGESQRSGATT